MHKSQVQTLVWVLVYAGLLTVCVSVFLLRAGTETLGWLMLTAGAVVAAVGAALVVVRARMEEPAEAKKGSPE